MEHTTASDLNSYLLDYKVRQQSLKTIQSYREVLSQFTDWCDSILMLIGLAMMTCGVPALVLFFELYRGK